MTQEFNQVMKVVVSDLHKMKFPTVPNVLLQPLYEDAQNMIPELLPVFLEHIVVRTGARSSPHCSEQAPLIATNKPLIKSKGTNRH